MADLSIFRFARNKSSGWAPAIGMFLGHYMAWICAALLLAALIKTNPEQTLNSSGGVQADPGRLAWFALGWVGIICVVVAGWTTANPTVYRAGLAFQGMVPGSKRFTMTLIAGLVATLAGIFPNLSGKLLGFVGTYGTVLGPMGAIIFVDYWLLRKTKQDELATRTGTAFNWIVLVSWLVPVAGGLYFIFGQGTFAAYLVIPCWIGSGILYLILNKVANKA
jgi:NCS1 family nucleobase:cation symporter-1